MATHLQEKLDEERREKTGNISLSFCLKKHAEEVAALAVEKGMKASNGKKMEIFEGKGTLPDEEEGQAQTQQQQDVKPDST
ncbi:hypothetical protein BdWA1_000753 [Babesia duncani]|uniref:Uncharacterized protein n=1 Tax=Babesia duncani TaxID=323732 RepID=A0AAD9PMR6_9APIC|nr:hypothetical protein BdWA1_000753 [Babesia duncani]